MTRESRRMKIIKQKDSTECVICEVGYFYFCLHTAKRLRFLWSRQWRYSQIWHCLKFDYRRCIFGPPPHTWILRRIRVIVCSSCFFFFLLTTLRCLYSLSSLFRTYAHTSVSVVDTGTRIDVLCVATRNRILAIFFFFVCFCCFFFCFSFKNAREKDRPGICGIRWTSFLWTELTWELRWRVFFFFFKLF